MTKTTIPHGDVKFYYQIHIQRQKALGLTPVTYTSFWSRLYKMNLHDAIYKPRVESQVREYPRTPIQDNIRRIQKLKEENIPIVDFDRIDKVLSPKQKKMAKYNMKPKKKTTLLQKFISLFRK